MQSYLFNVTIPMFRAESKKGLDYVDANGIDKIKTALDGLRDSQMAVEMTFKAFCEQNLTKENSRLRETVDNLNKQIQEKKDRIESLHLEHEELINKFKHELSIKRLAMLGLSERQYKEYLDTGLEHERAKVNALYAELQSMMNTMSIELHTLDEEERKPLLVEISDLRKRVAMRVQQAHERKNAAWLDAANRQSGKLNEIKNAPIEDAALNAVRQFFAWETFLGLKIISVIGALLLLLGAFTFGRYIYMGMGPALQCVAIFVLGFALIGAGEVFFRKKWRGGFTLALTAGGSAILFTGAALGHITLDVLPMWAALAICAGASLLTFAASLRYNEQLIAIFALVGGYLPAIALTESVVLFGTVYFTILSLLALLIATRKNWRVARFIGLGAGLLAIILLQSLLSQEITSIEMININIARIAIGMSIAINFLAYIIIPVFGALFTKTSIQKADIVLLSCNIFFHYLLGLMWSGHTNWHTITANSIVTAFFAICCIIMTFIVERQKHSGVPETETGSLRALFFITSITFSALIVLFALDMTWFSIGWLIQGTGLLLYGIFKNRNRFKIAGLIISIFCLMAFLLINVPDYNNPLFPWQYLSITIATVIISIATLGNKPQTPDIRVWLEVFWGITAFNFWGYMVYALYNPLMPTFTQWFNGSAYSFAAVIAIMLGFLLALLLPRIKHIYNYGFQIAAIVLGVLSTSWLTVFNMGAHSLIDSNIMRIAVFALYIIVNITAIGWINDLLRFLCRLRKLPLDWYPLLTSGAAMLLVTQNLVVQFSLGVSSLVLTLIFGLTALGWVVFGFAKQNGIMRVSGLAMAFFAVIKLFVLDLHGLGTTWRIISYFSAGIVLLTISFAYQWFNKRLVLEDNKLNSVSNKED